MNAVGDPNGLVPRAEVLPGLAELISLCGSLYKVDRAYGQKYGLVENTLRLILKGIPAMVRKRTAWGIQQALYEQRRVVEERPARKRTSRTANHYVSRAELVPFAQELVLRCGSAYAVEQRHGIRKSTLYQVLHRPGVSPDGDDTSKVRNRTAQRILIALSEQRRYDRQHGTSKRFLKTRQRALRIERQMEVDHGL